MQQLVVKLTSGADDPERCSQAFTVTATALAAGVRVSLWLTGEAKVGSQFPVVPRCFRFRTRPRCPACVT